MATITGGGHRAKQEDDGHDAGSATRLGEPEPEPEPEPHRTSPAHSDFVRSLDRGLAVIRSFGPDHPQLTLSEVARRSGLTRAASRRFLLTLVELGYVHFDGRQFRLRPRILELGYAYLSTLGLHEVVAPHMEALVATVHESSSVAVLDGDDIVYVVRVPTKRIMTVTIAVGSRFPAYATSMGRVLLAHLPAAALESYLARVFVEPLTPFTVGGTDDLRRVLADVRHCGYAIVDQELEEGLRSVAVPITDATGQVIAAINLSTHTSRADIELLRNELLPHLQACVAGIDADLRAQGITVAPGAGSTLPGTPPDPPLR